MVLYTEAHLKAVKLYKNIRFDLLNLKLKTDIYVHSLGEPSKKITSLAVKCVKPLSAKESRKAIKRGGG